jgi:hypothetical protein
LVHLQDVIFLLELVGHLEGTPGRIDCDHGALGPLGQVSLASVPLTTLQLEVEFLVIDCVDYSWSLFYFFANSFLSTQGFVVFLPYFKYNQKKKESEEETYFLKYWAKVKRFGSSFI